MHDLVITIIQPDIHWEKAEANLAHLEETIWQIREETDLIMLPEMFNTGFSMKAEELAEPMNGRTFKWLKQMAAQTGAVVCGSCMIREKALYFNRLIWMQPDGSFFSYDKRHLFRMAGEHRFFHTGEHQLIVSLKDWKILPLICYDLRFPVWSRNIHLENKKSLAYDLAVYIANWPALRISAWEVLLQARAIENLSYVAGINRTGDDGNGISYNGHSAVYNPHGEHIMYLGEQQTVQSVHLSGQQLLETREKFPAYLDSDHFMLS